MMSHVYTAASRIMSTTAIVLLFAALLTGVAQETLGDGSGGCEQDCFNCSGCREVYVDLYEMEFCWNAHDKSIPCEPIPPPDCKNCKCDYVFVVNRYEFQCTDF